MNMTKKQRSDVEKLIYDTMSAVDKTGTNTEYYKDLFSSMSDEPFYKLMSSRLPIRFHQELFKVEPKFYDIVDAFKVLDKPLFEKVKLPYLFTDEDGRPVESQECLVVYIHLKRMKQLLSKKTSLALEATHRDMKTGLLLAEDKGAKESDREFESLAVLGMEYTMDEFARPRADDMKAKSQMYNAINLKGYVSDSDIKSDKDGSLAKNMLNVYLIGANIHSNLVDSDYMTPLTLKNKSTKVERM